MAQLKSRTTGLGLVAGLVALLLWPAFSIWPTMLRAPFTIALALACASGVVLLALGGLDLISIRRDRRVLPARLFDLALGLALALPSATLLADLMA